MKRNRFGFVFFKRWKHAKVVSVFTKWQTDSGSHITVNSILIANKKSKLN